MQAERWASLLANRHRVTVVTRRQPGWPTGRETRDGFEIVRLPVAPVPVLRTVLDVRVIVRTVASLSPRPDLLLCFQTFVSGLAGVRAAARTDIPAVVWVRGESEFRLAHGRMRWISPWVWSRADGILVQSQSVRTELLAALGARSAATSRDVATKLEVVPNGLDLPEGPFLRGNGILTVGRLVPLKRMDVVMDASAACGIPLTIVGRGPERATLEARPSAANARFEGAVSGAQLEELYRQAGCFVLASNREGLPNALLEAMAFARPVIATSIAGVRELVRDEENGLLIPPDDVGALVNALRRLKDDPALAERLGAAARATAEGYGWDTACVRLEPLLERWKGDLPEPHAPSPSGS